MIGDTLKRILESRGVNVSELSRLTGIPSTTLYSMIKRNNSTIDLSDLLRICAALNTAPEVFYDGLGVMLNVPALPDDEEWFLLSHWRRLDAHGRQMTSVVIDTELERIERENAAEESGGLSKVIPLFLSPAAAGYASPTLGEDYEDYEVPADSRADFAAKIQGDSMEPYIEDGSIVLVTRSLDLRPGDVGLFCVDNDMFCKQYCEDSQGNIYLFSLNRERSDADIEIASTSGRSVFCYGKVLLDRRPPLPYY